MTSVSRDFGDTVLREARLLVSCDANFIANRFPNYKIGANNVIIEPKEEAAASSLKEIVAMETIILLQQQKRLSVRDLAKKFENGLATAVKLSNEVRWNEVASLDKHVLLKKLRDLLEALRCRLAGRNKDDAMEAISMVEALAFQLTQREGELIQEKSEVKQLAIFLKEATGEAKKVVEEERAIAHAEIDSAREAIGRVERAIQEKEQISRDSEKQNVEELMKEVQEARRIKMLHQPSKVMNMQHELQALRIQLAKKTKYALQLRKELAMYQKLEESKFSPYEFDGSESLGSCLRIISRGKNDPDLSNCSIRWFRALADGSKKDLISGATKAAYAPEPFDVGRILQAEIVLEDKIVTLSTSDPIDPDAGLGSYVEALVKKHNTEFKVVIIQINGQDLPSSSIHVFHIGRMRIKLCKGKTTKTKESYSASMQLCGVRGSGTAAAQPHALFWRARKGLSYTLGFESARERNAAIVLARRFAFDCNIMLAGPSD